jgi:hypothetical protein
MGGTNMIGTCPECRQQFDLGQRVGAKVGGAAFGAALGYAACSGKVRGGRRVQCDDTGARAFGTILGTVLGALLGHALDEHVLPSCPECRVALEIVDTITT